MTSCVGEVYLRILISKTKDFEQLLRGNTGYRQEYMASTTNIDKSNVVSRISDRISDSGGFFLKSNTTTPTANSTWSKINSSKHSNENISRGVGQWPPKKSHKKRKTKCNENLSTKFDDGSNFGHEKSNNGNNGNQDNFKRKRSPNEQFWLFELTDYGWVSIQRREYKHREEGTPSSFTKEHISFLNKLGFIWNIRFKWDERLQQLVDFNNEFNTQKIR